MPILISSLLLTFFGQRRLSGALLYWLVAGMLGSCPIDNRNWRFD